MRLIARIAPIVILALVLTSAKAKAQEITPANLPADTSFVIFSHSRAQIRAGAGNNPMVQSWYSPESAQVRRLFVRYFVSQTDTKTNGQKFAISPENVDRLLSVLENSLVFGISGSADYLSMVQAPSSSSPKFMKTAGLFFILDISGKEAQLAQLWPVLKASLPKEITHSASSLGGTSIEKFTGPNQTTFSAQVGNRFIWSNQQKVIEQLLVRLAPGAVSGDSLGENSDYRQCQSHPSPGAIMEGFFRIPDLSKLSVPATTPQLDMSAGFKALHLESIHALCGNISMTPDGELSRWTILGDTSQGTLLSWFGSNRTQFDSLALIPPAATSFMLWSFDIQAFYKSIKNGVAAGMPGGQQGGAADIAEGMFAMQLGMPVADALGLFRGEYVTIKLPSQSADSPQVTGLAISNLKRIMDLIHKLAPTSIADEAQENGVTYFKLASSVTAPAPAGAAPQAVPSPETFVALTPQFLMICSDKKILHDLATRVISSPEGAKGLSLADNPEVVHIRGMFPAALLGLSVSDYTHTNLQKEMLDSFAKMGEQDKSKMIPEQIQLIDALKNVPWSTFASALHWSVSVWWKDADGIHFENRVR